MTSGCPSAIPATGILAAAESTAPLVTFLLYTLGVFALAGLSNRLLKHRVFLSEYFLGSRSLGVWTFAMTFAATSASGGSFTGFPSKVYTHGWVLALWISSYMVVPICTMGILGKRLNQIARISGAITVPDVLRDRFQSRTLGLLAVSLIVFFMSFNLVAQFKAGSLILKVLLKDVVAFKSMAASLGRYTAGSVFLPADAQYLLCLLSFGIAVILYTTYGGFHAVVWTDVMQGVVMVLGVMLLLPLSLRAVGGLENATREMAAMTPPRRGYADVSLVAPLTDGLSMTKETWLRSADRESGQTRVFRVARTVVIPPGSTLMRAVEVLEITSKSEVARILAGETPARFLEQAHVTAFSDDEDGFGTVTIEFRASGSARDIPAGRWLVHDGEGGQHWFRTADRVVFPEGELSMQVPVHKPSQQPSADELREVAITGVRVSDVDIRPVSYAYGADRPGGYVTGPAPHPTDANGFLPLSLAISFFFMWAISGSGQPANMVRLMAFRDSVTLRRSILTVAIYYSAIYFPLIVIFCCARVLLPGLEVESDRIMPEMAIHVTRQAGFAWLAGLVVAAPFAAVMSTVDSFLLLISSAIVRDIYQRNLNPDASERTVRRLSYLCTLLVGSGAMLGAVNPPEFLQDIIVYVGSGLAACFLAPMVFALYWPRVNAIGAASGMLAGFLAHLCMYVMGIPLNGSFFTPYRLLNFDPILVGLFASFAGVWCVTRLTPEPPVELVQKYFYRRA